MEEKSYVPIRLLGRTYTIIQDNRVRSFPPWSYLLFEQVIFLISHESLTKMFKRQRILTFFCKEQMWNTLSGLKRYLNGHSYFEAQAIYIKFYLWNIQANPESFAIKLKVFLNWGKDWFLLIQKEIFFLTFPASF